MRGRQRTGSGRVGMSSQRAGLAGAWRPAPRPGLGHGGGPTMKAARALLIACLSLGTGVAREAVGQSTIGDSVGAGGGKVGTFTTTATPVVAAPGPRGSGFFSLITASTSDTVATPPDDVDSMLGSAGATPALTYINGTSYSTRLTSSDGIKFKPQSMVAAKVTALDPKSVTYQATPSPFGIEVKAPTGTSGEKASA